LNKSAIHLVATRCEVSIEAWHWTRDVVFREDASRLRSGQAPQNLASLRNLVIAILKTAEQQGITALQQPSHR
jgi:predicted transposase YbfD/YdcC